MHLRNMAYEKRIVSISNHCFYANRKASTKSPASGTSSTTNTTAHDGTIICIEKTINAHKQNFS